MKKIILIVIPLVILGVGAGLVLTGVVKIPGVNDKKQVAKGKGIYTEAKDPKVAAKPVEPKKAPEQPKVVKPPAPKVVAEVLVENKPEVGQKKLAKLWNEIEAPALKNLTKDWKDAELAPILIRMDQGKVAELLSALEPKRASQLSRELAKQASIVAKLPS